MSPESVLSLAINELRYAPDITQSMLEAPASTRIN